jgi:hypothetical protein
MDIKKFNEFENINENHGEDTPRFLGYWEVGSFQVEPGYSDSQGSEFQELYLDAPDFPNVDTGYSEEEIEEIKNLGVGEVWQSNHYGRHHMIWRLS